MDKRASPGLGDERHSVRDRPGRRWRRFSVLFTLRVNHAKHHHSGSVRMIRIFAKRDGVMHVAAWAADKPTALRMLNLMWTFSDRYARELWFDYGDNTEFQRLERVEA